MPAIADVSTEGYLRWRSVCAHKYHTPTFRQAFSHDAIGQAVKISHLLEKTEYYLVVIPRRREGIFLDIEIYDGSKCTGTPRMLGRNLHREGAFDVAAGSRMPS
jgi:hypothetical protein